MKALRAVILFAAIPLAMSGQSPWHAEGDIYRLCNGGLVLAVDAALAGRVTDMSYGGVDLLTSPEVNPRFHGSTLWISPQANFWPENPVFDTVEYSALTAGDVLRLESPASSGGLKVTKEYRPVDGLEALSVRYELTNVSDSVMALAPWSVLRVLPGLTFFPEEGNGCRWIDQNVLKEEKAWKQYFSATGGWLAHRRENVDLIICYPDIEAAEVPDGQGELEVYCAPAGSYVELETHGRFCSIAPGESISYSMIWLASHADNSNLK